MAYVSTRLDSAMGIAPERNEVQSIIIGGTVPPTGGTFTLTYAGQTTAGIAFDATAATIATALIALSNIGPGEVTGSGGPMPDTLALMTFSGTLGSTNLAAMTGSAASLTGGTGNVVTIAEATKGYGAQKVAINAAIDALGAIIDTQTTAAGCSANEVEQLHTLLYEFGARCAATLRDQVS